MKPKLGSIFIGLVLGALATLLLSVLPDSENLRIAYAFCLLGIVAAVAGALVLNGKKLSAGYALLWQTGRFLPCSLLVSIIVLVLQQTGAFTLPAVWHIVLQAALLAFFMVRLTALGVGKRYIERSDDRVRGQRQAMSAMLEAVQALFAKTDAFPEPKKAEAKAVVRRAAETLRYSDPVSTEAVSGLDAELARKVRALGELCQPGSADRFIGACGELCEGIRKRNEALKNSK